jgi:hypothetical protein
VILATSLKLAFLPSSPGAVPTTAAHRLSRYSPKMLVRPENRHEITPGMSPIAAKALGNAKAPAPMMVLARLTTEEWIEAMPLCPGLVGRENVRVEAGVPGVPGGENAPYRRPGMARGCE